MVVSRQRNMDSKNVFDTKKGSTVQIFKTVSIYFHVDYLYVSRTLLTSL